MLGVLGLEETQEAAYGRWSPWGPPTSPAWPGGWGSASRRPSARCAGWSRTASPPSHRPARPLGRRATGVALGALLTQQRHELEKAELAAAMLAEEYRAATAEPAVHDLVEVVTGAAAVAQRFLQLQLGATDEVCALVTAAPVAVTGMENHAEEQAAGRGVRYRAVVERAVLDLPDGITELTAALGRDEQVRVVERVPTKLVVADRALALVPLTPHSAEPAALVVHAGGLLELLSALFESVWRTALPLRLGTSGVTEQGPTAPTAPIWRSCRCCWPA